MKTKQPKKLTECRSFFLEPTLPKQRQYEALRAFFVEGRPSHEVARDFGYSTGAFRVLCHHFRRDPEPAFFAVTRPGPRFQPKKSLAMERIVELRKQNLSVYDISEILKDEGTSLSSTAVGEVLKAEGFARLPRRLDDERPMRPGSSVETVADVRQFKLVPERFTTECGGLFLFLRDIIDLDIPALAVAAGLPGSKMIPSEHALRSCLALKLWSIQRKSHITPLVTDPGLALFSGLNAIPKKSFLSEYSSRIGRTHTSKLLRAWHERAANADLFPGRSFNLDFHSVPFFGEDPLVENHYLSSRSRSQKCILAFLAQDADGGVFCYSNADIRKGEERDEVLRFVDFWKTAHGELPGHLVFDSQLTTYKNLGCLDDLDITFITLRRRSPNIVRDIANLPSSSWRTVKLDVPTRKYQTPKVFEQMITVAQHKFRQLYIRDLGHDKPTVLLTNDFKTSVPTLITRYARRMLIENALSDAVRFFHVDALSSTVGLKVDFDMAMLVVASGLYRRFGRRIRGYADAQARTIFRDLVHLPATVDVRSDAVHVQFHRRKHLPNLIDAGIFEQPVQVPWWNNATLHLSG